MIESEYPATFRHDDLQTFLKHLHQNEHVVLIGMKRVGIHNFLRFFFSQPTGVRSILVDLNDLAERTPSAFWILLLKRVVDYIQETQTNEATKEEARQLFLQSIQLHDTFFTSESARKLLAHLTESGEPIVLILSRFDRLAFHTDGELFANLQGLRESVPLLTYVYTSYKPFPSVASSLFAREQYLLPANDEDARTMIRGMCHYENVVCDAGYMNELVALSGGHAQYIQLGVLARKHGLTLHSSEEIRACSEELFLSLSAREQHCVELLAHGTTEHCAQSYLSNTGLVTSQGILWSPLFTEYVLTHSRHESGIELTKKEQLLFELLSSHLGLLVDREAIMSAVWPEQIEFGITDWAVDRLVARLRRKLHKRQSPYKVVTVITRGYKLIAL